ncbi:hypothetical protein V502_11076 [Pseudogymnoascus sp. VKM F-4520 (FW-2644)]|nr:hypothetical protein V502_11076 [Pseudogymnoascus sp. VKM F-4520 (FW-2644)]
MLWTSLRTTALAVVWPILFDLAIHTSVNDTSKTLKFRACTAKDSFEVTNAATAVVANDAVYDHSAVAKLQTYLGATSELTKNIILGYANGSVVGVHIKATASESILTQLCGGQRDADHTFGVATSAVADLAAV